MAKWKLSGKELRSIGYPEGPVISIAMTIMEKNYRHESKAQAIEVLKRILEKPEAFKDDPKVSAIADQLIPKPSAGMIGVNTPLNQQGIHFRVFGQEYIEEGAMQQMQQAAKLPVSVAGALMPDAHSGYGLPIGGVLATYNAVIPYGVGVDIGCRMCLSFFDIDIEELSNKESFFAREVNEATLFGSGAEFERPADHEILEDKLFDEIPMLRKLHGKAWKQLGSSGSGNHFAEFGIINIPVRDEILNVDAGTYVGLLTHSGSRALGANIANHYTKLAIDKRRLPQEAKNLAWLDMDEEEGIEYWKAMNLAGEYASACHHVIHDKIADQLGRKPIRLVENHHNFAWKELWAGSEGNKEVIVHRKGATPAGKDVLGVIPGSMTANGFIVKGKGEPSSISSASHGAGRRMSRTKAISTVTQKEFKMELEKYGIKLIGGGLDESPFAYKDINKVMESQKELVQVLGSFTPKIVKMDGAKHKVWAKKNASRGKDSDEITGE